MHKEKEHISAQDVTAETTPDDLKRDFLKRFGKYAATAPATLFLLMSPNLAKKAVAASCGTDCAP